MGFSLLHLIFENIEKSGFEIARYVLSILLLEKENVYVAQVEVG